jgi:hypothetical protein
MAKLNSEKWKKKIFVLQSKSLVGLTPSHVSTERNPSTSIADKITLSKKEVY